ncbi:aliphatic sulfonate ABC transporter substrate-binding protein [Terribacillus saccharophilus]|uniref:aliphatic sulfonate ABC transporter substrate-binding protein n=1 Tax=Terribacillus saccharophilus TaxID=361277 RepID=UPI000BA5CB5A|nr:aliphatic sulfonate ABC transporter substrate-binding protein [Terribacillus saccharophilus]PAF17872.1 ABC transporter substrate-binding protein [Terribacillus saccharophilus]PAF22786.1 ABC transporter substrate-binding protein [Terribacillus saccharophilus]
MNKIPLIDKRSLLALLSLVVIVFLAACGNSSSASGELKQIRLDYAYYSPASLVIKNKGWAEEAFKDSDIEVTWTLSQGSNKALEFLNSNSVDFGSTAGSAALLAKANGNPIQGIYLASKPEWTALVAAKDSDIKDPADLKGKKVAATVGTDPYIFLQRTLQEAGLNEQDVEIVNLQHADGASALLSGDVDAWAGLDPHMAKLELENDAQLFYRNEDFNTYNFLNVRKEFAENHPEEVKEVLKLYDKAREWIEENPEETAEIVAKEAGISQEVAAKQLERNDFSESVPGDTQREILNQSGAVLEKAKLWKGNKDVAETVDAYIEPKFAQELGEE